MLVWVISHRSDVNEFRWASSNICLFMCEFFKSPHPDMSMNFLLSSSTPSPRDSSVELPFQITFASPYHSHGLWSLRTQVQEWHVLQCSRQRSMLHSRKSIKFNWDRPENVRCHARSHVCAIRDNPVTARQQGGSVARTPMPLPFKHTEPQQPIRPWCLVRSSWLCSLNSFSLALCGVSTHDSPCQFRDHWEDPSGLKTPPIYNHNISFGLTWYWESRVEHFTRWIKGSLPAQSHSS